MPVLPCKRLSETHSSPSKTLMYPYVDPLGEAVAGGLVKAPKITFGQANRKYG